MHSRYPFSFMRVYAHFIFSHLFLSVHHALRSITFYLSTFRIFAKAGVKKIKVVWLLKASLTYPHVSNFSIKRHFDLEI